MANHVIIGASLTGASAAIALREQSIDANVTLIGVEDNVPFVHVADGKIDAVVGLNNAKDVRRTMPLIKARRPVDPDRLRDASVDLRSLLEGA